LFGGGNVGNRSRLSQPAVFLAQYNAVLVTLAKVTTDLLSVAESCVEMG